MPVVPPSPESAPNAGPSRARRKAAITVERITAAALQIVAADGYDALTMRSVAAKLDTGAASLYAHVRGKADLDELVIGHLCAQIVLPAPDAGRWRDQIVEVCRQLREQYLAYPGISAAVMSKVVTSLDALRVNEGMLAILLAGGVSAQAAAWAIDALSLYVAAYTLEISLAGQRRESARDSADNPASSVSEQERAEVLRRFEALPAADFPHTRKYAAELTAGDGHERFDFTVALIVGGLG
jgi:AcrR family transcriptional regulator